MRHLLPSLLRVRRMKRHAAIVIVCTFLAFTLLQLCIQSVAYLSVFAVAQTTQIAEMLIYLVPRPCNARGWTLRQHHFFVRYRAFDSGARLNQLAEQWLR
jgi:hypothetical protein